MIITTFFLVKKENLWKTCGCKLRPEAPTRSDILHHFIWSGKSYFFHGKSQGIVKSDACDNHVKTLFLKYTGVMYQTFEELS